MKQEQTKRCLACQETLLINISFKSCERAAYLPGGLLHENSQVNSFPSVWGEKKTSTTDRSVLGQQKFLRGLGSMIRSTGQTFRHSNRCLSPSPTPISSTFRRGEKGAERKMEGTGRKENMKAKQLTCTEFQLTLTTYLYGAHLTRPSEALRGPPPPPFILPLKKPENKIKGGSGEATPRSYQSTSTLLQLKKCSTLRLCTSPFTAHNNHRAARTGLWERRLGFCCFTKGCQQ